MVGRFFKIVAVAQIALLAGRHLGKLTAADRARLAQLVRHPASLTKEERKELRAIVGKLEPGAFLTMAADRISPFPLPGVITDWGKRQRSAAK